MNTSSFVNDEGILKWYAAHRGNLTVYDDLKLTFNITDFAMGRLFSWLFTTIRNSLVNLIYTLPHPIGIGMSISEYSENLYVAQWANGTHIKNGFDLGVEYVKPFELGIPTSSGISLVSASALLNPNNPDSFIDVEGITKWIDAYEGDTSVQTELITTFGLNMPQLNLINDWLFDTLRYNVTPSISELSQYTEATMAEFAMFEYYRQWTNGTCYQDGLDLGPIQGLSSVSGWELGIPIRADIDKYTAYMLWDQNEDFSLVNWKGISLWFEALSDTATYNFLLDHFNDTRIRIGIEYFDTVFTSDQLDAILIWIVNIRENFVLESIQLQTNFPTDNYTLGNNIFFMFTIAGGVVAIIGALGFVITIITRRK